MKTHHYHVYLRPEKEGGYTVTVPALPGCITFGKTVEEARTEALDAIQAYLTSLEQHGEPLLTDTDTLLISVDVAARA